MFDYIEKLQEKSDHHKRAVAFFVSFGVTGIIFLIWISTFFVHFGESTVVVNKDETKEAQTFSKTSVSPFGSLKESVAGVSSSFHELRSLVESLNALKYEKNP